MAGAILLRVGHKSRSVYHRPVSLEIPQFGLGGADEHVVGKKVGPGILIDHADPHPIIRVGADKTIADKQFLVVHVADYLIIELVKFSRVKRLVDGTPPNLVFR